MQFNSIDLLYFQKGSTWYELDKYVDGVADLKLPHFEFPSLSELRSLSYVPMAQVDSDEYAVWLPGNPDYSEFLQHKATAKTALELWFLWATPNSVIFIDEAQRYFRPRPAGSPVPLHIKLLEYHRHFGVHFILVTQKERLLHSNVRALAGQHIHIGNTWRGRHRYEWQEVKDTDSKSDRSYAARTKYKLPAHVFPYYKSAVTHLSVKHGRPMFFYIGIVAALVVLLAVFASINNTRKMISKPSKEPQKTEQRVGPSSVDGVLSSVSSVPMAETLERFTPVVPGRPETAPAYDSLRQVKVMPMVSACLQTESRCFCYTQQGTRVADMGDASCRSFLAQGPLFNPYAEPQQQVLQKGPQGFNQQAEGVGYGMPPNRASMERVTAPQLGRMVAVRN